MGKLKKFMIGALFTLSIPAIYLYLDYLKRNPIEANLISKDWVSMGTNLDVEILGYNLIIERVSSNKNQRDTIYVPSPDKLQDYYIEKTKSFLAPERPWAEHAKDVIECKKNDQNTLDYLITGRRIKVEIGRENAYKTNYTITPDKITILND